MSSPDIGVAEILQDRLNPERWVAAEREVIEHTVAHSSATKLNFQYRRNLADVVSDIDDGSLAPDTLAPGVRFFPGDDLALGYYNPGTVLLRDTEIVSYQGDISELDLSHLDSSVTAIDEVTRKPKPIPIDPVEALTLEPSVLLRQARASTGIEHVYQAAFRAATDDVVYHRTAQLLVVVEPTYSDPNNQTMTPRLLRRPFWNKHFFDDNFVNFARGRFTEDPTTINQPYRAKGGELVCHRSLQVCLIGQPSPKGVRQPIKLPHLLPASLGRFASDLQTTTLLI